MANLALMDLYNLGLELMKLQTKTGLTATALLKAYNGEGHQLNISQMRRALVVAEKWEEIQELLGFPDITIRDAMKHFRDYP